MSSRAAKRRGDPDLEKLYNSKPLLSVSNSSFCKRIFTVEHGLLHFVRNDDFAKVSMKEGVKKGNPRPAPLVRNGVLLVKLKRELPFDSSSLFGGSGLRPAEKIIISKQLDTFCLMP